MSTYYSEFDSTVGAIINDLISKILSSGDWSQISNTSTVLTSTTASVSAGATTLTVPSGVTAITAGMMIAIDVAGSTREWRKVSTYSGTTITLTRAVYFAHSSGVNIYAGNAVLKATTTRGADMIIDFADADGDFHFLQPAFWRTHTGSAGGGGDRSQRWLYWRNAASTLTASSQLHVTVSAGKEHLFVMIEGPRSTETGPQSTSYGSNKSYLFACDFVPYSSSDTTAAVYIGGNTSASSTNSVTTASQDGHLTRNFANTASWDPARLGTICFPLAYVGSTSSANVGQVNLNHQCSIDGKFYLFPYVVFSNSEGPRGRLGAFFNAGFNEAFLNDAVGPAQVGAKVTYNSVLYKLVAVDRGTNSYSSWGQFGASPNEATGGLMTGSNVVAIPCT